MSTAVADQAAIRARVARAEHAFASSPSPALKKLEREQRAARKTQPQQAPEQAQAAAPPLPAPPPVVLLTEAEVAAIKAQGVGLPPGKLQAILCPLEGYEGVCVTYRTNNFLGVIRNTPDSRDKPAFSAWAGLFVRRIEWPYTSPPPDISTPEGLVAFEEQSHDLLLWIIADGYRAAREQAAGPTFPAVD